MEQANACIEAWRKQPNYKKKLLSFHIPSMTTMPDIPDECEELLFYNCRLERFDKPFPSGLRVLVIRSCSLKDVPTKFPNTLEQLVIETCRFAEYIDKSHGAYCIYPSEKNRLISLPPSLKYLMLFQTGIVELPKHLPRTLTYLNLLETYVDDIPELPEGLRYLYVNENDSLPYLPDSLERLYFDPFEESFEDMDAPDDIHLSRKEAFNQLYEWPRSQQRSQARCRVLKEELMMMAWHPRRVQKWLEAGDAVYDILCGVED